MTLSLERCLGCSPRIRNLVAPPSRRLSGGRLARRAEGETPLRQAQGKPSGQPARLVLSEVEGCRCYGSHASCYPRNLRQLRNVMKIKSSTLPLVLLFAISAVAQTTAHFDGQTWWSHIKVLADDKLEGRDTGSRGERAAQAYAVEQLKSAGAEAAGSNGFYQPVKFVSRQIVEKDCSLTLIRDGKRETLTLGEDAIIGTRIMPAPEVEAPLVFVGYGLKVPEKNYDDFAGLDVRGKIIVIFSGSPSEIPGALASHYQTAAERWKVLRAAGAVGIVSLMNPNSMDIPWSRIALNRAHPSMDLDYPEFSETEGAKLA